jgi:hypothetical protein
MTTAADGRACTVVVHYIMAQNFGISSVENRGRQGWLTSTASMSTTFRRPNERVGCCASVGRGGRRGDVGVARAHHVRIYGSCCVAPVLACSGLGLLCGDVCGCLVAHHQSWLWRRLSPTSLSLKSLLPL